MTAPLLLLSELKRQMNTTLSSKLSDADTATANTRLRELIREASALFTVEANGRRFDQRVETQYYTPYSFENDGDLVSTYELSLSDDLLSINSITNGDGTAITEGYTLTPRNQTEKWGIRLSPMGTQYWTTSATDDPYDSVEVAGVWGYGGSWSTTGSTVGDDPLTAAATTIDVGDGGADNFEVDMVLKIGTEYLIVTAVTDNTSPTADTVTAIRSYNGSTAVEHVLATAIYYYKADDIIRRAIVRLVSWALEQAKSPMFGTIQVADVSIPVNLESMPKDVVRSAKQVARRYRILGV